MAGRAPRRRPAAAAAHSEPARASSRARRFSIVAARFHEAITARLVEGALAAFKESGVDPGSVDIHWVPGTFELPQAAALLAKTGRYAAIACIGVVIRGETPHFEHVAREAASGIRDVALATGVPVSFGVVTALSEEQAWARAGGEVGNRGQEAAEAAVEMAELVARLREGGVRRPRSSRPARRRG